MEPLFSPAELEAVKAYHWPADVALAVDLALWPPVLAALALAGTRPLYRLCERLSARWHSAVMERLWGGPGWAPSVAFAVLLFGALFLVDLPADVWGYARARAFGLSLSSPWTFAGDELKSLARVLFAAATLALGMFGLARRTRWWWLVLGVVGAAGMVGSRLVDPYRSQLYVAQHRLEDGPLRARLEALLAAARIEVADILVDETARRTVRLQAYFAGSGPTRTVVLNDALLGAMSEAQIVAAVAHEAGHVGGPRWPWLLGAAAALVAFLASVEWLFRRSARGRWFGITERGDIRCLPLILLVFDTTLTVAGPISAAWKRRSELEADAFAVRLTGDPRAFQDMLRVLARTNKLDPTPPWWVTMVSSHPPVPQRIDAIGALTEGSGPAPPGPGDPGAAPATPGRSR